MGFAKCSQLFILFLLMASVGLGANYTANFFCANSSTLNQSVVYYERTENIPVTWEMRSLPCAWGCVQGECLDGSALAYNAFLTLIVYMLPTIAIFWLAQRLDDRYQFTKTALIGLGLIIGIAGIIVTIAVYPVASGTMSAIVPSLFTGITDTAGVIVVLVGLMVLVIWTVRKVDLGRIERGES